MLKDWKRRKDIEEKKIAPVWEDSKTGYLIIVDNRGSLSKVTLATGEHREHTVKEFKTKAKALAFAKSYMRRN